tara:strand:- start:1823 stop:3325 length:1503 start_codon:yes stop_codon:yes gene_type:complete
MAKTEIKSEISLSTTKFQRSLARTQTGINKFAKNAISKFGAIAGVGGLGMLARSAIDLGSKISDMAVQMNIGTTQLQVLDFAAREAGVGTEILARALRNVQLRTEEAINGNKSYGDAFKRLGINIEEFRKLPTEKKLEAIAIAQSKATDKAAAYNAVSRILGEKAGPALQEVLQNLAGPDGYGGLEAAAERAGEVMSKETIAKMDAAADKIESFKRRMTVLAGEIIGKAVPAFQMLADGIGFISDYLAFAVSNSLFFGQALGSVISTVVAPAMKQFEALGLAIKAAGQFAKRDFDGAKESLVAAKDAAGDSIDQIKKIPEEIGDAFEELKLGGKTAMQFLEDSIEKRSNNISKSWNDMTGGMVEDIEKAAVKINNTSIEPKTNSGSSDESSSASKSAAKSKSSFDAADTNKSGIVTGREQRAKETADRRARTQEVAGESGKGERKRSSDRDKRFDSREAAAGLNLAGNDPTAGRKKQESESAKQTKALESIEKELKKNPS